VNERQGGAGVALYTSLYAEETDGTKCGSFRGPGAAVPAGDRSPAEVDAAHGNALKRFFTPPVIEKLLELPETLAA
jgi:hypothetical protein